MSDEYEEDARVQDWEKWEVERSQFEKTSRRLDRVGGCVLALIVLGGFTLAASALVRPADSVPLPERVPVDCVCG